MIQAPSLYSPRRHLGCARERCNVVLINVGARDISPPMNSATRLLSPVQVIKESLHRRRAPHFVTELAQRIERELGARALDTPG